MYSREQDWFRDDSGDDDGSESSDGDEDLIIELTNKNKESRSVHSSNIYRSRRSDDDDDASLSEGEEEIFEELTSFLNSSFTTTGNETALNDTPMPSQRAARSSADPASDTVLSQQSITPGSKGKSLSPTSAPPFLPGDHVYRWHKISGIPAYHHHAIVMRSVWDAQDESWMLHVSDFSNISLRDAVAKKDHPQSGSRVSPAMVSNPFVFQGKKGCQGMWRTYVTPATEGWTKVIYKATAWEQVQNPSAGTATHTDCDTPQVVLARALFLQEYSALVLDMPYHWVHNNCETAAVWCKTGQWCTLQALCALVARTAIATQLTATTMLALPINVVCAAQPYLIPLAAAYGLITIGVSAATMKQTISKWRGVTERLNSLFEKTMEMVECEMELYKNPKMELTIHRTQQEIRQ